MCTKSRELWFETQFSENTLHVFISSALWFSAPDELVKLDSSKLQPCLSMQSAKSTTSGSGDGCNLAGTVGDNDMHTGSRSGRSLAGVSVHQSGNGEGATSKASAKPYKRLPTVLRTRQGGSLEGVEIGALMRLFCAENQKPC